jgi:hypothetical protein
MFHYHLFIVRFNSVLRKIKLLHHYRYFLEQTIHTEQKGKNIYHY